MTGKTRDYLADLANKKGVTLPRGFQDAGQAEASEKIEELKAMPDVEFPELSDIVRAGTQKAIAKVVEEMNKWTFAE